MGLTNPKSLWGVCLLLQIVGAGYAASGEASPDASETNQRQVLHLHTEFLPYRTDADGVHPYRQSRELIRQAMLLAARDEMGAATCDETLHETPPRDAPVLELRLAERADAKRNWRVKLASPDGAGPVFEKTYRFVNTSTQFYSDMIPVLEAECRGAFVEALQAAGLRKRELAAVESRDPGAEIEEMLRQVDFVAQYAAVRAAHRAIAEQGESPGWLGVLVRGYANLAMLTRHQWCTATEVFAARAWLYAQRMMVRCEESRLARWHRAYAWTLTGTLHLALDDLRQLTQLEAPAGDAGDAGDAASSAEEIPSWTRLIKPYSQCDRQAVKLVGDQAPELKPWALRMWFELTSAYGIGTWVTDAAEECAAVIPTASGVFADTAIFGAGLGTTRMAAEMGPRNVEQSLHRSVGAIAGLPDAVQKLLGGHADAGGFPQGLFGEDDQYRTFSGLPRSLAMALRKAAEQDAGPDPSWSLLAFLLEEEQFVQIANYLLVATNAVEYSLADEVDSVLPLVQDHRYAAYIDSYRYNSRRDVSELQKVMGGLQFEDPRMNARYMFSRSWNVLDSAGDSIGKAGLDTAYYDFTMPSMVEYARSLTGATPMDRTTMAGLGDSFRRVAPGSDMGKRTAVISADQYSVEQLRVWEGQLKEDPFAFMALGDRFDRVNDREGAIRCYDKSYELAPSCDTTTKVAKYHFDHGDFTKWEQMLLQFLRTEDRGLEHANVQAALAGGYAVRGMWRKAKPHAVAAGQTASSWGMKQASYVTESLGEWEESEEWMRGSATAYASADGYSWYFWCRRTGRGDVQSAEGFAAEFFKVPLGIPQKLGGPVAQLNRNDLVLLGGYHLLQGDRDRALETYRKALAAYPSFTCAFMVSQLLRENGDHAASAETLAVMKEAATAEVRREGTLSPEVVAAGLAVIELMTTGDASEQRLTQIDALLSKVVEGTRCAFAYFIAKELERLGKTDLAEQYWRRSLVVPAYDPIYATLSGVELAKRHGTSRPDDDELDEDDLWPPKPREQQERP